MLKSPRRDRTFRKRFGRGLCPEDGQWRAFPRLREFSKKNEQALRVVTVAIDDPSSEKDQPAQILQYVKKYGVDFPVAWDHALIERMTPYRSEPVFFLVDRRGITRAIDIGVYADDIHKERESAMQKVIDER